MKHAISIPLIAWLLLLSVIGFGQKSTSAENDEAKRAYIIEKAPIIFMGRPLQQQYYADETGIVYFSTLIQVLEVLRGGKVLQVGTVEHVERFAKQTQALRDAVEENGIGYFEGRVEIYFAQPSKYPLRKEPFSSTNRPLTLTMFEENDDARIEILYTNHGTIIRGLYHGWLSEEKLYEYLNTQPDISPLTKKINFTNYPEKGFDKSKQPGKGSLQGGPVQKY